MNAYKTRLRELRENAGSTQQKVADDLNYTLRTYQEYERGKISIPQNDIPKIADYFSCTSDYLFYMDDEMQPQAKEFQEATGLSERSVAILRAINGKENGTAILDILNQIFENPLFYSAIKNTHNLKVISKQAERELTENGQRAIVVVKLENEMLGNMKDVIIEGKSYCDYLKFLVKDQAKQLFEEIIDEEGK